MKIFLALAAVIAVAAGGSKTRREYSEHEGSHYSGNSGNGHHEIAKYAYIGGGQGGEIGLPGLPPGGFSNGPGSAKISKSVYVFSAPPDPFEHEQPQVVRKFPSQRQKHYQVVFINAPNPPRPAQHTVELPPPPELKTQIYVLVKKPQPSNPIKIVPAKVPVHKPEVYFIRYQNQKGGVSHVPVGPGGPIISAEGGYGPPPGPVEVVSDPGSGYGAPPQVQEDYNSAPPGSEYGPSGPSSEYGSPQQEYGSPAPESYTSSGPEYGPPIAEYGSQGPEYGAPQQVEYGPPSSEYGAQTDYGTPVSQYVSASGAFGYDAHNNGGSDAYGGYSRRRNHFTLRGSPLFSARSSWRKNARSDSGVSDDDKWTPIPSSNSHRQMLSNNKEVDAGMSGI